MKLPKRLNKVKTGESMNLETIEIISRVVETIQKLKNGDLISDNELKDSIKFLEPIVLFLGLSGKEYHFTWKETFFNLEKIKKLL